MYTPSMVDMHAAIDWLLDADPALRWQVLRDLTAAPATDVTVKGVSW